MMFVDDALVVKIFQWKNDECFVLIKGVCVDDWLGYICNLKPTQQSFFFQARGSSTLLHSSGSNVLLGLFFNQNEAQWGRYGGVSREEVQ